MRGLRTAELLATAGPRKQRWGCNKVAAEHASSSALGKYAEKRATAASRTRHDVRRRQNSTNRHAVGRGWATRPHTSITVIKYNGRQLPHAGHCMNTLACRHRFKLCALLRSSLGAPLKQTPVAQLAHHWRKQLLNVVLLYVVELHMCCTTNVHIVWSSNLHTHNIV